MAGDELQVYFASSEDMIEYVNVLEPKDGEKNVLVPVDDEITDYMSIPENFLYVILWIMNFMVQDVGCYYLIAS